MKVLYAVQATGNGHLSRCMEFYPSLSKYAEVDVLLSGIQGDLSLPFPVKYKFHGLSFIFGTRGGIDYFRTALSLKPFRFIYDTLRLDLSPYDLIVNDFEPITAWACRIRGKTCVSLSHQAAFLSTLTPRPKKKNWFAEFIFKHFAPSNRAVGLHYKSYDKNIYTPVVRSEIRNLATDYVSNEILVYLPAYSEDTFIDILLSIKEFNWRIFSKHSDEEVVNENVFIYPVGSSRWIEVLSKAPRAIIGGGFEGPSEMLYLRKKLLVVPMSNQYEQLCNAAALEKMGVQIEYDISDPDFSHRLVTWLRGAKIIEVDFPRQSEHIALIALGLA